MDYYQKYLKYKNKYTMAKDYYEQKNNFKLNKIEEETLMQNGGNHPRVGEDDNEYIDPDDYEDAYAEEYDFYDKESHKYKQSDDIARENLYKNENSNKIERSYPKYNNSNNTKRDIMDVDNLSNTPSNED